jgi:hypothetical protein
MELIKSIENTIKNAKSNILVYEILLTAFGQVSVSNPINIF